MTDAAMICGRCGGKDGLISCPWCGGAFHFGPPPSGQSVIVCPPPRGCLEGHVAEMHQKGRVLR